MYCNACGKTISEGAGRLISFSPPGPTPDFGPRLSAGGFCLGIAARFTGLEVLRSVKLAE
jgi:hypothetical protein